MSYGCLRACRLGSAALRKVERQAGHPPIPWENARAPLRFPLSPGACFFDDRSASVDQSLETQGEVAVTAIAPEIVNVNCVVNGW
jgi:hypothetical protein